MSRQHHLLAFLSPVLLAMLATASMAEDKVLVRFHDDFDLAKVQPNDVQLKLANSQLRMKTGHSTDWPGITLGAPQGGWNLTASGYVSVDIENLGANRVDVNMRVDDPGSAVANNWLTGRLTLKPGERGTLKVQLAGKVPEEVSSKLFGMRGYPGGWQQGRGIDLSHVVQLIVFVARPSVDHAFKLGNIRVEGSPTNPLPENLDTLFPMIDRFGQYIHKDWPGKLHDEEDFSTRKQEDSDDFAAHPGPEDWNQYGGWQAGPKLQATGRFRVEKHAGKWWFVDPLGNLFWSHGADCVRSTSGYTPITDREHWFAALPGKESSGGQFYGKSNWAPHGYYQGKSFEIFNFTGLNLSRKYGTNWSGKFNALAHRRLRSWGMNTIANWSDPAIYRQRKTPYVVTAGASSRKIEGSEGYWGKFPDPFDPKFKQSLGERLVREKGQAAGDPWCLGYFVSNELSWGDELSLAIATLTSPPDQPAKRVFLDTLKAKYETIQRLNAAWGSEHNSWDALLQSTTPPDKEKAREDLAAYYTQVAEQYFRMSREAVKEADPGGLYLGCRFAWVNDRAVRASVKYCDVVSFNRYNRSVADLGLPDGCDKPIVIGEFHFGALDRGMLHTGLVPMANQQQRAEAYENYVRGALKNPRIIGTHWFQYGDQATTGRGDGENYQIGLLDICDTPYAETIAALRKVGYNMYRLRLAN